MNKLFRLSNKIHKFNISLVDRQKTFMEVTQLNLNKIENLNLETQEMLSSFMMDHHRHSHKISDRIENL